MADTISQNIDLDSTNEESFPVSLPQTTENNLDEEFKKAIMSSDIDKVVDMIKLDPPLLNKLISDQTPFEMAVSQGFTNLARTLSNYDHFELDAVGHEALSICLKLGQTDLATDLIKKGANPNVRDEKGQSLLLLCLNKGDFEMAERLINSSAEIDSRDIRGWSALIHASFNGWAHAVDFLLQHGASVNLCSNEGWNAIVIAYAYGHSDIVKLLQAYGGKFGDSFAKGALLQAYKNRNLSITKQLLSLDISPNFQYDSKNNLLARSALDNEWAFAEEFILAGADPNSRINNKLPIISHAIQQGQFQIVETLIKYGASVNLSDGNTYPIHFACRLNQIDTVKSLLQNGACIEVKDEDGDTPLITAIKMDFYALARFLISKGANPEQRNIKKKTAIDYVNMYISGAREINGLLTQHHQ